MIPYGRQSIDQDDIDAVIDVLKSDFLTCGPKVEEFEESLAGYCGAKHAVAVSNGTAALHVAMLAAGLGEGDRVVTSAITFLASANCAEFVGATADFADIDPVTRCVSTETLKSSWKDGVAAAVPVDFAGYPCVTKEMADFVHGKNALVIEDASHAIGGGRDGHKVGGLPWVDMTTFSFHPVKTMTTGEGGAILTNDETLAVRCRRFRSHGMIRGQGVWESSAGVESDTSAVQAGEDIPWLYAMSELGYNYRITDMQCALGLSQLGRLDRFVTRRQEIVARYNASFANVEGLTTPLRAPEAGIRVAWHLYVLQIDFARIQKKRAEFMSSLREQGIGTQVHYIPVNRQPYYRDKYGSELKPCPAADAYYASCLTIPLYPAMTDEDVGRVIHAVKEEVRS